MSTRAWNSDRSGKAFCADGPGDARGDRAANLLRKTKNSRRMAKISAHLEFFQAAHRRREWRALAGGCGIATLCDFTLAAPQAKFGYTEVKIGFCRRSFCFSVAANREKRTRDLLLTGRILDAEAKEIGLINEIVPAEKLMDRAKELADILIAQVRSVTRAKRLLIPLLPQEWTRTRTRVLENARIRRTPDFKKACVVSGKEKPVWRGDSD